MTELWKKSLALAACAALTVTPVFAEDEEEEDLSVEITEVRQEYEGREIVLKTAVLDLIEADGYKFKDHNKNGELDPFEDWRLPAEDRAKDLVEKLSANQLAAQLAHITLNRLQESFFNDLNVGYALAYTYFAEGGEEAVRQMNYIQSLSEDSEMGLPVVFSMDSVIGCSWINGTTILPDAITLAATGDAALVEKLGSIQREEMKALGIRMSLSPNADLATDPRWGRNQETYGEDPETAKAMVKAMVTGLQNGTEGVNETSVAACVKHFPGSGPQTSGVDGTPLVFDDETFALHTSIFAAAMEANPASIMPYGYSTVPYLGGDAVDNFAHESSVVMSDVLRGKMGYTGLIQTDWGLSPVAAMLAGADVMGGMGKRDVNKLVDAADLDTLKDRAYRALLLKFKLGVFENPFVDAEVVAQVVGTAENYQVAMEAAEKAATLLKYENQTALDNQDILVAGSLARNVDALSSGWKISSETGLITEGKSILEAIEKRAGKEITYIETAADVAESYDPNTTAIVVLGEASGTHEPAWGTATLSFPQEQLDLINALDKAGVNVVTVVLMNRPYVITPVSDASDALLIAYRPGVTAGAEALAHVLFGDCAIGGKLPWQLPATMDQVLLQREDLPKDIADPAYDYGFGFSVSAFGAAE